MNDANNIRNEIADTLYWNVEAVDSFVAEFGVDPLVRILRDYSHKLARRVAGWEFKGYWVFG